MRETIIHRDDLDFSQIKLLKYVSLESIKGLLDACTVRTIETEEILMTPGQKNRTIYFLLSGRLRIHLGAPDGEPIAILGPGESVGEMSVIDRQPASAFVVADEASRLLAMDEDILWSLVRASHEAACNLLFILTKRLRQTNVLISDDLQLEEYDYQHYGTVDALTGLHNRHWLDQMLERQVLRSTTNETPLSLIMLDIDYFKEFNERYGHLYGDHVLYSVASTIGGHLRPREMIARYCDDEFVILLPEIGMDVARSIALRLIAEVMEAVPITPSGKAIPHPTISAGIAELKTGQTASMLLAAAEAALNRAKESGPRSVSE
ncbi:MAG: GGDEF domain-containing protein [Deltaproteobacteria bacterium]|nr:GGDEF domain-containing protein [Deltaproteobacteria bacterium]